jgi:hypothetical protein
VGQVSIPPKPAAGKTKTGGAQKKIAKSKKKKR